MITLLSPSKGQDFATSSPFSQHTIPIFIDRSQELINVLKTYSSTDIQKLMSVSEKIADLNVNRFQNFTTPFTFKNSKQAIFSFTGDVYSRIESQSYSKEVLQFGQNHLRILSGLYGLLRPLDLIQPYRLEMKTKLPTVERKNLYQFWGSEVKDAITSTLHNHTNKKIINLASNEYFKVLKPQKDLDIITINFKEIKNNKARVIAIFAKRARGLMAHHIMQHRIDDHAQLKQFTASNYCFSAHDSDAAQYTFTRLQP